MKICVIGAGYVGLIASLAFAKVKNEVICVEKNNSKVKTLNKGEPTIYEEGISELLNECLSSKNILFTSDIDLGVKSSDIIFLAVGTPEGENEDVDMSHVYQAVEQICNSINNYKVIINKSTVPVGTQKEITQIIRNRGISVKDFDVVSNPEFLREGKALDNFLNADRIVIGCDTEKAKKIMLELYKPFKTKIIFTNPETAELMKYASNAFLATKISFINEIANLCDKVEADIETIAYGMGLDKRISPLFLRAGIGYGGSCFPKDTKGLVKIGKNNDVDFEIVQSAIEVNEKQRLLPVKMLMEKYNDLKGKTIAVLGLSFKPGTDDIREAPAIYIIKELIRKGAEVKAYDPIVLKQIKNLFPNIHFCTSVYDAARDSDCIIICTEWEEFKSLDFIRLKECMHYPLVIDGRNMLDFKLIRKLGLEYYSVGRNVKSKGY